MVDLIINQFYSDSLFYNYSDSHVRFEQLLWKLNGCFSAIRDLFDH